MWQSPQFSANVYCGQTAGWIKMALGMEVGHIVLDGDPALPPQKGGTTTQFSGHVYCGQTAGWIKMPLDTKVGLGPGRIDVTWGPNSPPQKKGTARNFLAHSGQPVARLSYC